MQTVSNMILGITKQTLKHPDSVLSILNTMGSQKHVPVSELVQGNKGRLE